MAPPIAAQLAGGDIVLGEGTWRWLLRSRDLDVLAGLLDRADCTRDQLDEIVEVLLGLDATDATRRRLLLEALDRGPSPQAAATVAVAFQGRDRQMVWAAAEALDMPGWVAEQLGPEHVADVRGWERSCHDLHRKAARAWRREGAEVTPSMRWMAGVAPQVLWREAQRLADPEHLRGRTVAGTSALLGMTGHGGWRTQVGTDELERLLDAVARLLGGIEGQGTATAQEGAAVVGALADAWLCELGDDEVLEDLPCHQRLEALVAQACPPSTARALRQRSRDRRGPVDDVLAAIASPGDAPLVGRAMDQLASMVETPFVQRLRIRLLCHPEVHLPARLVSGRLVGSAGSAPWPGVAEALCTLLEDAAGDPEALEQAVATAANLCWANPQLARTLLDDEARDTAHQGRLEVALRVLAQVVDVGGQSSWSAHAALELVTARDQIVRLPATALQVDRPRRAGTQHRARHNDRALGWLAERLGDHSAAWEVVLTMIDDGHTASLAELAEMAEQLTREQG